MFAQRGFEPIRELKASDKLKKQTEKLVELCFRKNHSLDIDADEFNSKVERLVFKKLGKSIVAYKDIKLGESLSLENLTGKIFQNTYYQNNFEWS